MQGIRLEPTAALVMRWARPIYRSGPGSAFLGSLDLSSGEELHRRCATICDWYGEVICNRKYFIRRRIGELVSDTGAPCRLVILAAGRSPLALEMLASCGGKLSGVIEADITGMAEKQDLYATVAPGCEGRIRCLDGDLTDDGDIRAMFGNADPGPASPTIVLMEGISYYLTPDELGGILRPFRSPDRSNRVIIEYLVPCRQVALPRRRIPQGIFGIIREACGIPRIWCHTPESLAALVDSPDGGLEEVVTMQQMEHCRTGANRYFRTRESGWIECAVARL
jgi:O-methyltransferase involved in polyketide biosynthesis